MARWHLSSDETVHDQSFTTSKEGGLEVDGEWSSSGVKLTTYEKWGIDNTNFVVVANGEWVCSAGTLIFNDQIGGAALREFYRVIEYIRSQAANGNFFNHFSYYLSPFQTKRLYDPLVNLPTEYRESNEFQIRLINYLSSKVFEVPVYSGVAPARIDTESYQLKRPAKQTAKEQLMTAFKRVMPSFAMPVARRIYSKTKSADPDDERGLNDMIRDKNREQIQESKCMGQLFESRPNISYLPNHNDLARYAYIVDRYDSESTEERMVSYHQANTSTVPQPKTEIE